MNRKGFAGIIILIILVAGIGVALLVFSSVKTEPLSTVIPTLQSPQATNVTQKAASKITKVSDEKLLWTGGYADPTVVKLKNGTLVMYVNKFGTGGSGYKTFTSSDGLTWGEKSGANPPTAATGRAVRFGDQVRFYYPGLMPIKPTDPAASIFSSISFDGYSFTKESGERVKPKDGYYLEGPTVIQLEDSSYRMYFNENETASKERRVGKIYGASSSDALTWTRDEKATIESDQKVEKAPADWPQALHPFVVKRPTGGYLMLYNTHSKIYAATSTDGVSWTKIGYTGINGADADGYYLPDGTLRVYFGNFSPETSGVVYTVDLKVE